MNAAASRRRSALCALLDRDTRFFPEGFSVDLTRAPADWDRCLSGLGLRQAYRIMSAHLCRRYREQFGKDFLFGEGCVAYELRYHVNAYLWARGFPGYLRHVSTWLFSREDLIGHCREVDISVEDVASLRQRLMFRYRDGVRGCYRGTEADPFLRKGPFSRLTKPRRMTYTGG